MTFGESLLVSLFSMFIVFVVLVSILVLIQLFSKLLALGSTQSGSCKPVESEKRVQPAAPAPAAFVPGPELSTGELRLKNVDEKTAAMIMAIVSDESSIPLSELRFKSIKLIEEES
ncbi:MAG: OadG family protein [Clostridia bacterium]|nr:OadG family protein [Clostridia bacterium]